MDDARPGPRGDGDSEQEAYADVIGEDAVSDEGVFTVHEGDGEQEEKRQTGSDVLSHR